MKKIDPQKRTIALVACYIELESKLQGKIEIMNQVDSDARATYEPTVEAMSMSLKCQFDALRNHVGEDLAFECLSAFSCGGKKQLLKLLENIEARDAHSGMTLANAACLSISNQRTSTARWA